MLGLLFTISCKKDPSSAEADAAAVEADAAGPGGPGGPGGGPPPWMLAATSQPRGLMVNEPAAAPGYVLFSQLTSRSMWLIDQEGQVVHQWTNDRKNGAGYLQDNGDLLRAACIAEPPNFKAGGVCGYLQRISWDGELLWEWKMGDDQRILHHDIEPLPNGNILAIAWELKTREEAIAAGRDPKAIPEQGLWADWVLEIEPIPPNDGRIVWQWHVWDHLVQYLDEDAPNYGDPARHPRRLDLQADLGRHETDEEELAQLKALGYVPDDATVEDIQSDFLHMNGIDYNAELDQIAVSLPEIGEVWIIDHSTTTEEARGSSGGRQGHGGDLLYRWGNPRTYGRGTEADQQLFYQHQVEWVPEGYPGAGNLTIFNNGGGRPDGEWSSVLEITPPVLAAGSYEWPADTALAPAAPTWVYPPNSWSAEQKGEFFAPFISGVHRLENGNTFLCQGPQGRFIEVTPEGQVVWEYHNTFNEGTQGWEPPGTEDLYYAAFRAQKISPDHPGLKGRDLTPLDPQPAPFEPPARE
jgi:hypothetical protein